MSLITLLPPCMPPSRGDILNSFSSSYSGILQYGIFMVYNYVRPAGRICTVQPSGTECTERADSGAEI